LLVKLPLKDSSYEDSSETLFRCLEEPHLWVEPRNVVAVAFQHSDSWCNERYGFLGLKKITYGIFRVTIYFMNNKWQNEDFYYVKDDEYSKCMAHQEAAEYQLQVLNALDYQEG